MAISQSNDSELNEDLALGPGKRLREARIARSLEIEDVATRLRLHVRTIKSIEADDYAHLPAPTFVRGYLRGYARLLDLPCGPIVESYERNDFAPPPLVPDISRREEVKSTDFPVRMVTYAIAGVLVIFVTIWWQSQQSEPVSIETGGSAFDLTTLDAQTPDPDLTIAGSADNSLEESATDADTVASISDLSDDIETTPGATSDDTELSADAQGLAAIAEVGVEVEPVQLVSEESGVSPSTESTTRVESVPDEPGVSRLKIVFSQESWVEIYGKDGKTLFYDLAKPGQTINLSDTGALRVVLGVPGGAKIEFNGKPFDPAPHTTAGIARFTLKPSSAIAESQFLEQPSQQQ